MASQKFVAVCTVKNSGRQIDVDCQYFIGLYGNFELLHLNQLLFKLATTLSSVNTGQDWNISSKIVLHNYKLTNQWRSEVH